MSLEITNMKSVLRFAIDTEVKVKVAGENVGIGLYIHEGEETR
jgi:hypothetical protein